MSKKIALITGATAGIGEATAHLLAKNHLHLIITGRRNEKLIALKQKLESEFGIEVLSLCFDIQNREQTTKNIENLPKKWKNIDILVNNAGLAKGKGPILEDNPEFWETMIDTNVKGLLYISQLVGNMMKEQKSGHIINLSSIAGKLVYPNGVVYCATKHALDAINKGLRMELLPYNIRVTSINPGAVETEFSNVRFLGDQQKADAVYEGYTPLVAQDIAETIWFAINRPPHVNINELIIMPTAQASPYHLHKE